VQDEAQYGCLIAEEDPLDQISPDWNEPKQETKKMLFNMISRLVQMLTAQK